MAILFVAMLLTPALALILTMQVEIVAASPGIEVNENLWVDSFDYDRNQWATTGAYPWLDASDFPTNTIVTGKQNKSMGDFHFQPLSVADVQVDSVILKIGKFHGAGTILEVFIWDMVDWVENSFEGASALENVSWDVSSIIDTVAKINNAMIYFKTASPRAFSVDFAYLEVTYTIPEPGQPTLLEPENGIATADTTPTFSWENGAYASKHRIEVDDDSDFSSVIDNENSTGNSWTPASGYSTGTYYWRVWAVNDSGENVSDDVWEFTITTWWDTNWGNRRKIEISPLNSENYQIKIFFDNLGGMKSDLSDLRFLENVVTSETLPHWVENYTADNATVWVRRLENADNSIYVYYSNPSVNGIENGDNVFVFFDNFDGSSVNLDKWNIGLGTPVVQNSTVVLENDGTTKEHILADFTYGENYAWRWRTKHEGSQGVWEGLGTAWEPGDQNDAATFYITTTMYFRTKEGGSATSTADIPYSLDEFHIIEIARRGSHENVFLYIDNVKRADHSTNIPTVVLKIFHGTNYGAGQKVTVDWSLVRKYVYPEPTASVGVQEPPPVLPTKPTLYSPSDSSTITDETPEFVWTKGKNADYHRLLVSSDNTFTSIVENENIGWENHYTIPSDNFLSDGKYWWKVSAMSENGENASATWSFTVKAISVFEASSGVDVIWTYENPTGELFRVAMSENGDYIVIIDDSAAVLRYFSKDENDDLWSVDLGSNGKNVALSDNGYYVAASAGSVLKFYDNSGTERWTYTHGATIEKWNVKMSGDGVYVTAGGAAGDPDIMLFDGIGGSGTETPVWSYTAGDRIREIAISDRTVDNRYFIAAVSMDHEVYLFDNDDNVPIWTYTTGYSVYSVDISENGQYIVAGGYDNKVYLFENDDNTPLWTYEYTDNTYTAGRHMWYSISISDNGQYIAGGLNAGEGGYFLWSKDDNIPIWTYIGQEIRDIIVSGSGNRVVGTGHDGTWFTWGVDDNVPIWYYGDAKYRPDSMALSENGHLVAGIGAEYLFLAQDGSFAYELKTEGQTRPYRILTTTPEFSFKLPSRKVENTSAFRVQVGENVFDVENLMWNPSSIDIENEENEVYHTYAGSVLSEYITYQWRVKLKDNENNWSPWSVTRSFEIVELTDFANYRIISFTENIPDNYQVKISIDNATNMNENFKDLLFYDSTYPNAGLPFWIENFSKGSKANVWVKVRDNGNVKLCYNNANAENASYGEDTFILFDNFDGTSVDFKKWTTWGPLDVSDGWVTLTGTANERMWTKEMHGTDLSLRIRANIGDTSDNLYVGFSKAEGIWTSIGRQIPGALFWGVSNNLYLRTGFLSYSDSSAVATTSNASVDYLDENTTYELKRIGTDNVELWANDDNLVVSNSTNIASTPVPIYFCIPSSSGTIKVDWIFLRKCLAVEPTVTIGGEESWGWKEIENWTGSIQNPAPPTIENLYITDMDNVAADNLAPETQYKFWVEIADNETLADIENVTLVLYLDNENLADNTTDHYTFKWGRDIGESYAKIPANLVGTSSTNIGTVFTYQRKTFYAAGRYWAFYSDAGSMKYKTSSDGSTWSSTTTIRSASNGKMFSITFDGTFMHYAYGASGTSALYYRRGVPLENGDITWSAAEQALDDNGTFPSIIVSGGYPWISYAKEVDVSTKRPYVIKSSTDNGTFTIVENFPYELSSSFLVGWYTAIGVLTDNKVYVYYAKGNPPKGYGKLWDGTSWGAEENIFDYPGGGYPECFSLVAFGDNVFIIYLNWNDANLYFKKRTYGTGWENDENFSSVVNSSASASLTIDNSTGDLHAFYQTGDNWIRYKKYTAATEMWDETSLEFYYENEGSLYYDFFSTFERVQNNMTGIIWTSKTSSPYNVKFAASGTGNWLSSPSGYIITDNCVVGDNAKTVDNFIFAIEFGENATVTADDNWDVWVQVYDSAGNQDNRFFLNQFDIVVGAQWELIETWTGTVEAPVAWQEIENWSGSVEAPAGWQLIETWSGSLETPVAWELVETWTGTVEAVSQWSLLETWTGTIQAPSAWQLIESWSGTVEAVAQWGLIETWTGTVQAPSVWILIESWSGTVQAPATWGLIETWTGTVEAPVAWELIETWSGTVEAFSGWSLVEEWSGTVEAFSGWSLIEEWSGVIEAYAEWTLIETWTGTVENPAVWDLIETWTATIQAPAEWQLTETWDGNVQAPSAWELIETWTGAVEAFSGWQLLETWTGVIEAVAGWELIESWDGTVQAPSEWLLIETWVGSIETPTAWQLISTWTGTIQAPSVWDLIDTWTGTIQAPSEWSLIENWTGSVIAVGWRLVETWHGTVRALGWLLTETWTGSIRTPAVYAVSISITPSENSGTLGDTLTYTVIITNIGGTLDNYDLTSSDAQGWATYLDNDNFLNVSSGENRETTLNVGLSTTGTHEIIVTATGTGASDSDNCTAISATAPDVIQIGDGALGLAVALMAVGLALCAPFIAVILIKKRRRDEEGAA